MKNDTILLVILLSAVVTWIPRILPFVITRNKMLPPKLTSFLRFLPLTIMSALLLSSIMDEEVGRLPIVLPVESLAVIPTFLVVWKTKNLVLAVLVGVLSTAILRCFL